MRGWLLMAAMALIATPAFGQQALDPAKPADQATRYVQALNACDVASVRDLIDPDVSSIGAAGQYGKSKQIYIAVVQAICRSGMKVNLKPTILRDEAFGDIAIEAFEMRGDVETGGKTVQANQRVTMVMRRERPGAPWRILHIQTANATS